MHHSITTRLPATRHPPPTACRPQHTCAILPTGDLAGRSSWSPRDGFYRVDDFQLSRVPHMVPTASGPMLAGRSTLIGWTRKIILSLAVTQAYGLPAAALPQMPDLMEVGRPNGHIRPLPLLRAALPPPARSRRGGRTKRAPAGRERTASRRRPADAEHHGLLPRDRRERPPRASRETALTISLTRCRCRKLLAPCGGKRQQYQWTRSNRQRPALGEER